VTNGGLHGEVAGIEGTVVQLKVADNVKVRVSKSAVAGLQGETEGGS
jgi:preprotein translocase subunit YajC